MHAGVTIFTNPFQEMEDQERAQEAGARKVKEAEAAGAAAGEKDEDYKVQSAAAVWCSGEWDVFSGGMLCWLPWVLGHRCTGYGWMRAAIDHRMHKVWLHVGCA